MTKPYAGPDTGQRKTWIFVVDGDAAEVFSQAVETDPRLIHQTLKPFRRQLVSAGHETGRNAPSLHRALARLRLPVVCLDALKVRAALASQRNKTDRNDARGIATMLARGIHAADLARNRHRAFVLSGRKERALRESDADVGGSGREEAAPRGH